MREIEQRALDLLTLVLEQSRKTRKDVDDYAGVARGTTSQILKGRIELKLRHALDVLAVCGVAPDDFFRALFESPPVPAATRTPLREQIRAVARAHDLDPRTAVADADRELGLERDEVPIADLIAVVREQVRIALAEGGRPAARSGPASEREPGGPREDS